MKGQIYLKFFRNIAVFSSSAIILSGCLVTQEIDTGRLELPGMESNDYIIEYSGYTVSYDMISKIPEWVAYELSKEETYGDAQRDGKRFDRDPSVLVPQADDKDYRGSGWTRGHMAPAADFRWDDDAMWETFVFTNCCPQDEELNNGVWNTLEKKCRTWARKFGNVHIVTGPIIGRNIYGSIGKGRVTVPDAFFKAVLIHDGSRYHSIAFIMANKPQNDNLQKCAMSVDELESLTGFDLFPALDDSVEEKTEREFSLRIWKL